jgi:xylulose-5-phosphate/fructose-6-phosphate phosphoketolase
MNTNELDAIRAFWNAANFLSAGMLYLKQNPLLLHQAEPEDFKENIYGHWGVCPVLNAVYAHVSSLIKRKKQSMELIVGSGHGGSAVLACAFLDGSLFHYYQKYSPDINGITHLFNDYGTTHGFSTEISAKYPGMKYLGGELGAALAFSQGYVMDNPEKFVVCLLGDGELETSITKASWQGFGFVNTCRDGRVLPVINSNGFKMGSESLFSHHSKAEINNFFSSYNIQALFADANHESIYDAFDTAYTLLTDLPPRQPVIIINSPKGWSAPPDFLGTPFTGSYHAHKPILRNPKGSEVEAALIDQWLRSYEPEKLFTVEGYPSTRVEECLPEMKNRIGMSELRSESPTCKTANRNRKEAACCTYESAISIISNTIKDRMVAGEKIRVFSPDELESNRLYELVEFKAAKMKPSESTYQSNNRIIEVLNEHLCFMWAQGYAVAGNTPIIVSYEGFAQVFESCVSQYIKYLSTIEVISWRKPVSAINIILTSLGWNNTPTHHNPGFVDGLTARGLNSVHIYLPVTCASAGAQFSEMMYTKNRINVMLLSKYSLPRLSAMNKRSPGDAWRYLTDNADSSEAVIFALGDIMAEESLMAADRLRLEHDINVAVIAIEDLSVLEEQHGSDRKFFVSVLKNYKMCLWVYNGFTRTIKAYLWDISTKTSCRILGYLEKDQTMSGYDRLDINGVSSNAIVETVLDLWSAKNDH